jgi:6-pyruvoyltetrahydropterin/6-carboxytetrahydropterin synthase
MSYKVIRSHEICAGHRVVGHESKCRHLHGHNYVFHFHVAPKQKTVKFGEPGYNLTVNDRTKLDDLGRVIDFSVVKSSLCEWLEHNWDHKFLHWEHDNLIDGLKSLLNDDRNSVVDAQDNLHFFSSLVSLPFNPTAENLAAHMVNVVGPELLDPYGVELVQCVIEETSKCHVEYTK